MTERLRRSLTSLSGDALGSALRDVTRSFGRLPGAKKAAVVGVGLLVLLVLLALLGPLALLVVALAFGAGLIGVIVRVAQRRSVTWRDPVAPALLALVLALVGVYDARHAAEGQDTGGGAGGFVGDAEYGYDEESGTDYFDAQNSATLLSALRYEDPDGVEIEDATVSGTSATVFVDTSEVTGAEAEYICDYTLDLSRELYEEGAWEGDGGMAGSLIEVEVKGRASFFDEASCSLGDR